MLTMAELFSGIGGWSEAARMAGGITPVWCCDIDKKKNEIYALRHPNVPNLGDIRNIESAPYADIFTVSFPCTGISSAGKGEGLKDPNSRLWFEAERLVGQIRPRYVVYTFSRVLCAGMCEEAFLFTLTPCFPRPPHRRVGGKRQLDKKSPALTQRPGIFYFSEIPRFFSTNRPLREKTKCRISF